MIAFITKLAAFEKLSPTLFNEVLYLFIIGFYSILWFILAQGLK